MIRFAAALAGAAALALALAPAATAGRVTYTVVPGPLYSIEDNGSGIVKVTYNGCVTAGAQQLLNFSMTTSVTHSAPATFSVLKAEGQDPVTLFEPNPVNLVEGPDQSFAVLLAFSVPSANNGVTAFRIKLDPASGEGLGQGPGIMVRIPCVLAAPPSPGTLATQVPPSPAVTGAPPVAVPTRGVFPTVGSSLAAPVARCISTPQGLRVRARRTTRVRIVVRANGQGISGARVRITLPGGRMIFRRTGSDGTVRVFVRPSRSGTLVIQSDVCFGAKRVTVRRAPAARRSTGRFTG